MPIRSIGRVSKFRKDSLFMPIVNPKNAAGHTPNCRTNNADFSFPLYEPHSIDAQAAR